jgi:hypothetical protein
MCGVWGVLCARCGGCIVLDYPFGAIPLPCAEPTVNDDGECDDRGVAARVKEVKSTVLTISTSGHDNTNGKC